MHPAALRWRLFTDEELADLAADIKAHGLKEPIVLDKDGCLIDGRNRLRACTLAGVEPRFALLPEGEDPVAFVRSRNRFRRQARASEMAMEAAVEERESEEAAKRTGEYYYSPSSRALAEEIGTSQRFVIMARTILAWAPGLAQEVIDGASLAQIHRIAVGRKQLADATAREEAQRRLDEAASFAALERDYPEIAAKVATDGWTAPQAIAYAEAERPAAKVVEKVPQPIAEIPIRDPGTRAPTPAARRPRHAA